MLTKVEATLKRVYARAAATDSFQVHRTAVSLSFHKRRRELSFQKKANVVNTIDHVFFNCECVESP